MILKKIAVVLLVIFSVLPINRIYAQVSNTGFVQANIWYSKDPFEEGDKIKIYTLLFNPDSRQLSGTVNFFDNSVLLGKKNFSIAPGATNALSIDWTVTAGKHDIFGEIENAKFLLSDGSYEAVTLSQGETEKSSITVAKKIVPVADTGEATNSNSINNSVSTLASSIENTVTSSTPSFISGPIISTTSALESFRQNTANASQQKETDVKSQIKALDENKTVLKKGSKGTTENTAPPSSLLKPFKYVELFFLTIASFILNNQIIFYAILIIIVFLIF